MPGLSAAVLVPVKAFALAKARLAPALPADQREALARAMAGAVLAAAGDLPVAVVCEDDDVADWAASLGALVVWAPGRGLNGAVEDGVAALADRGAREVVVAHADIPDAFGLDRLTGFDGVTLVPDRREDGTNVACIPARAGFRFSSGPGSLRRHLAEVRRLGLDLRTVREPSLAWDVDRPCDLRPLSRCAP
ncbi:MAG: 2-phospho-L-lactate guanylyltransferase [Acidimicrobiales bacterium]